MPIDNITCMEFMRDLVGGVIKDIAFDSCRSDVSIITVLAPCRHEIQITSGPTGGTIIAALSEHFRVCLGQTDVSEVPNSLEDIHLIREAPAPISGTYDDCVRDMTRPDDLPSVSPTS